MALIKRRKPNDSIKKFELSAEHKYQAGLTLIDGGDVTTGIEQLGYAAEMLLKSAYFRFMKSRIGLPRTTSVVTYRMLRYAALEGVRLHVRYDPEGYHSLLFWALLLAATRRDYSQGLPQELEEELRVRVRQLHGVWMIENRYQPKQYLTEDVLLMRSHVTWLRDHHRHLWR
jgi:hypothetical protein